MSAKNPDYEMIARSAVTSTAEDLSKDDSFNIVGSLMLDSDLTDAEAVFFHSVDCYAENDSRAELYAEVVGLLRQNGSDAELVADEEDVPTLENYLPYESFETSDREDFLSESQEYESSIHITGRAEQAELDRQLEENGNRIYFVFGAEEGSA